MNEAIALVKKLIHDRHENWTLDGNAIDVRLVPTDRRQRVTASRKGDTYILESVVLGAARVTKSARHWRRLALLAWLRNAEHDLVTFAFDTSDRLIGLIEQPAATLDEGELGLCIDTLAYECDRFEYVLTGGDQF